ncbi:MAG: hypothetical protein ACJAYE_003360 [Candidatus Azotimanducaceae bacterium]|jgi:hypothetical protein
MGSLRQLATGGAPIVLLESIAFLVRKVFLKPILLLRVIVIFVISLSLASCQSALRLNEIQVVGSHNSFKQPIEPQVMALIAATDANLAASLDYSHPALSAQLNAGIRKVELDVFYDPKGGLYQSPQGLSLAPGAKPYDTQSLALPGFKVMHIQDIDFRSHCPELRDCLRQLAAWSSEQPNHLPIFITINPKDGAIDLPGFVKPLAFDDQAWLDLDQELRNSLGNQLFTPDEFRGTLASLPAAVKRGWPKLTEMRGRFIVVLDARATHIEDYINGHPVLMGRAMFANAREGTPEAAIRIINDPVADFDLIQGLVKQGYIVRTRSDADTREARTGDSTRRDRAFASGAHIISTDYYLPDPRFSPVFKVALPDGVVARCNPVSRPEACTIEP